MFEIFAISLGIESNLRVNVSQIGVISSKNSKYLRIAQRKII
jgi:hypothetical protein